MLTMLSHIGIDPVWYGSERRCQTVRPLQPGQLPMQTYTAFGSDFDANQQLARSVAKPEPLPMLRKPPKESV
jgi:hypothetical protein